MAQDPLVRPEPFLLHATDGRMRVWRHKNAAYTPRNIQPTVSYGGGSVMVWGCISHDCKLGLVTIQGNLTGDQYIRDVLQPVVVPHFNNHPLATRTVYMDDNARPPRSREVTAYLQSEAVTFSLASHEPGFESHRAYLGHVRPSYTCSGTSCAKHYSVGSSIASGMAAAITTGWMRRRVEAVIQARGCYTRYWTLNNRCRQMIHKWRFESEMTNLIVLFELWRSILKMDMFYCKNWPCDIVIKYSLN